MIVITFCHIPSIFLAVGSFTRVSQHTVLGTTHGCVTFECKVLVGTFCLQMKDKKKDGGEGGGGGRRGSRKNIVGRYVKPISPKQRSLAAVSS